MDGDTFDAGSVAYLRGYRDAISIARAVMQYTSHTLLVGEGAEQFAKMAGFPALSASDNNTVNEFEAWVGASCQPNYFTGVAEAEVACGPYHLGDEGGRREVDGGEMESGGAVRRVAVQPQWADSSNHDTIGMVAISNPPSPSSPPSMACGTSTNGADHKIAGRVGDSPITGAGCYVDSDIGGAAATGDGDIMMRFLPAFHAVSLMAVLGPEAACRAALARIAAVFPSFQGGLVCVSRDGRHGAAAHNMGFSYSFADASGVQVVTVA
ncbi:asparaginase-domain-containing protein [Ochromonadaceae sp. CCMP2298]|nr:asparaginase-domain-containing protein [Ochromonadaceae sp. CCMP2298]